MIPPPPCARFVCLATNTGSGGFGVVYWYYMIQGAVRTSEKRHVVGRSYAIAGAEHDVGVYYYGAKHVLVSLVIEDSLVEKTMQRQHKYPARQCSGWKGSFGLASSL